MAGLTLPERSEIIALLKIAQEPGKRCFGRYGLCATYLISEIFPGNELPSPHGLFKLNKRQNL